MQMRSTVGEERVAYLRGRLGLRPLSLQPVVTRWHKSVSHANGNNLMNSEARLACQAGGRDLRINKDGLFAS